MPLNAATMPEATRCRSSGATLPMHVQSDGEFKVARIEIHQMIRPLGRNVVQQFLGQVAVRVNDADAMSKRDVLQNQIPQQGRFAGAGFADDVDVLPLVHGGNAKRLGIAPAIASPIVMWGWSFMVPKPAATPATENPRVLTPRTGLTSKRRQNAWGTPAR